MKYKGILLDLDNTLYNYDYPHQIALKKVSEFFYLEHNINSDTFFKLYINSRQTIHSNLIGLASSHSRLLYFQNLCENLGVSPFKYALTANKLYWATFIDEMKLYDGVMNFFKSYKGKICIVTDLTSEIQFKKINKLKIDQYIKYIVTSEESGCEKPNSNIFLKALNKINLKPNEVCMIGDNFNKDIIGAINLNIDSYWLNNEKSQSISNSNEKTIIINSFTDLLNYI